MSGTLHSIFSKLLFIGRYCRIAIFSGWGKMTNKRIIERDDEEERPCIDAGMRVDDSSKNTPDEWVTMTKAENSE